LTDRPTLMSISQVSLPERQLSTSPEEDVYDDGYLRVEHRNYYVACEGHAIKLPRTEFLIISRLARSADRIVPAEELWQYAWGAGKPLNPESLHVYIYRLRAKLLPYDVSIDTMINVGYRLLIVTHREESHV
jgi:DNA-binding response OmpR family regulator